MLDAAASGHLATAPDTILSLSVVRLCLSLLLLLPAALSGGYRAKHLLGATKFAKAAARFCGSFMLAADQSHISLHKNQACSARVACRW